MSKLAFDNNLYLKIQREEILKRISSFGDKLYLEFGGKLFEDFHASRVLPGFRPNSKLQMLLGLKKKVEIVICVNNNDILNNKIRNDIGITYTEEVERLIDSFRDVDLYVSSVVISFYEDNKIINAFENKLKDNGINVYHNYTINGYPNNINTVVSDEGFGKNDYCITSKPLVVVTAPGPGSGKMAFCLSQLYHDSKSGLKSGYAKYETFPVWNLPLKHPVNLAYESATVDLDDVNMIDPYHFSSYGVITTNYNRDVEAFPLLKEIFEHIYGTSPYNSPTDMGVNMLGFAIKNEDAAIKASKDEIIRRYFQTLKNNFIGRYDDSCVNKVELLMKQADVMVSDRKCVVACFKKYKESRVPVLASEVGNKIIYGKESELFTATSALILNLIKHVCKIDDSIPLISKSVLSSMIELHEAINGKKVALNASEILIALSIQSKTSPLSEIAINNLSKLNGLEVHSSELLNSVDYRVLSELGFHITEEPKNHLKKLYTQE